METELMAKDCWEAENLEAAHIKEVYARFGLAMYQAQVLEHGLVNALTIIDLIPNRRHLARTRVEWESEVDSFMDRHFETTMGRMLKSLRGVTSLDASFESQLSVALTKRNWLAHDFFRERAAEFMSAAGRHQMLKEIDQCFDLFKQADMDLEGIMGPLRRGEGMTDEMIEEEFARFTTPAT